MVDKDGTTRVFCVFGFTPLCVRKTTKCLADVVVYTNVLAVVEVICLKPRFGKLGLKRCAVVALCHLTKEASCTFRRGAFG